jgi:hypothetical protein
MDAIRSEKKLSESIEEELKAAFTEWQAGFTA